MCAPHLAYIKAWADTEKSRAFSLIYYFPGFDCECVYGESLFVCAVHQAGKQTPSTLKSCCHSGKLWKPTCSYKSVLSHHPCLHKRSTKAQHSFDNILEYNHKLIITDVTKWPLMWVIIYVHMITHNHCVNNLFPHSCRSTRYISISKTIHRPTKDPIRLNCIMFWLPADTRWCTRLIFLHRKVPRLNTYRCSLLFLSVILYLQSHFCCTGPVFVTIMLLASLNSCTNPWIYLYYS